MYIYDNLGSPTALLTQNNVPSDIWKYDPYGVVTLTQESSGGAYTPFLYTGGTNDRTTGWTLNGARYYDAAEGRWTQMDTLDAPLDPSNANRYAYAANNPINYTDPTGQGACLVLGIVSGAFAAVSAFAGLGATIAGLLGAEPVAAGLALVSGATAVASVGWGIGAGVVCYWEG